VKLASKGGIPEIGNACPNCSDAGILYLDELYVRCDNCDYERFSTQAELDSYINDDKFKSDPNHERLLTLIEEEPVIKRRDSRPMGMRDFTIER
tara:strand:+ start:592 stop:873 length:282 start_codon:yes stop_codon:yes gene_type:complete